MVSWHSDSKIAQTLLKLLNQYTSRSCLPNLRMYLD